jgi:predicted patatin/cPLA2 family phospholipase
MTQPNQSPNYFDMEMLAAALRKHTGLARAFLRYRSIYARSVAFLRSPPPGTTVIHVVPERHLGTSRMTQDRTTLERDYARGRAAGVRAAAAWSAGASARVLG